MMNVGSNYESQVGNVIYQDIYVKGSEHTEFLIILMTISAFNKRTKAQTAL
jgi:hypothetical protein